MFITQCNISCIFLFFFFLSLLSLLLMLSMPQKSKSHSARTKKEEKYQRNKEKQGKKSRGLPPSVLSSLFFSITARQGSNKDSNVFSKKNLSWSWSLLFLHTFTRLYGSPHQHTNVHCHFPPSFLRYSAVNTPQHKHTSRQTTF